MYKIAIIIGLVSIFLYFLLVPKGFLRSTTRKPWQLNQEAYDYVIVGAGSAGCVLAARLSEDEDKTVLLLEAGGEETDLWYSHIPIASSKMAGSKFDWKYKTEPQESCCDGLSDKISFWPRGKVLGGTSVLNGMQYVRGHPSDYDKWAEMTNDSRWSYDQVLPYFKKTETVEIPDFRFSANRGHSGPIHVTRAQLSDVGRDFLAGVQELGYNELNDATGAEVGGFGLIQYFSHNGSRQSTVRQYLRPAMLRSNLHVVTDAHVTKILLDGQQQDLTASGVQYLHDGQLYEVKAKREVIISAGTVNSPQILMLSGIGPGNHLKEKNVKVHLHSPHVGRNLQDHTNIYLLYSINVSDATEFENMFSFTNFIRYSLQYLIYKGGPYSKPAKDLVGFFRSGLNPDLSGPDLQMYVLQGHTMSPPTTVMNMKPQVYEMTGKAPSNMSTVSLFVNGLHPLSTGTISLKSADPTAHPEIMFNYFDNELDVQMLAHGLRMFVNFMNSKAMQQKYRPNLLERPATQCRHVEFMSDDYLRCVTRQRGTSGFHQVGTCRMGPDIHDSVVDSSLKVHGVKNLRVVDASIFPDQVSGNTNAPAIMVAEKAADMIKEEHAGLGKSSYS